jgi:hypothetical protein
MKEKSMRRMAVRFVLAVVLCTAALPSIAQRDPNAAVRQAIMQQYRRMETALAKKDINEAVKICLPNAQFKSKNMPTVSVTQWKKMAEQTLPSFQSLKITTRIDSLKVKGSEATVEIFQTMEAKVNNPQTNRVSVLRSEQKSRDIWVKSGSGWLLKLSDTFSEKSTLDGQPLPGGS